MAGRVLLDRGGKVVRQRLDSGGDDALAGPEHVLARCAWPE
jgi:hypothetical protein